jgi:UDP-2,3-diacylglucosamine hydrolase
VQAPIQNEADNGLKNEAYTVAMARTAEPHSATAQFFINVANNDFLNHRAPNAQGWGYCVFGKVVEGQDVVDRIKAVKTGNSGFPQRRAGRGRADRTRRNLLRRAGVQPVASLLDPVRFRPASGAAGAGCRRLFLAFLDGRARAAEHLFILGDLFEAWPGDDCLDDPEDTFAAEIVAALGRLVTAGVGVSLLHGNRDFLLGERFAARSGVRLLPDPHVLSLPTWQFVLSHGDLLCTDDRPISRFGRRFAAPTGRTPFSPDPSRSAGRWLALRQQSESAKRDKAAYLMDVNPAATDDFLRAHGYASLIHGHTHRPATGTTTWSTASTSSAGCWPTGRRRTASACAGTASSSAASACAEAVLSNAFALRSRRQPRSQALARQQVGRNRLMPIAMTTALPMTSPAAEILRRVFGYPRFVASRPRSSTRSSAAATRWC